MLSLVAILFYVSGNFLNDWADREWDKSNRPERALPRGLFSGNVYLATAIGGAVIGLALTAVYGIWTLLVAAVLVCLIWLYTKVHKKASWSVILMGLCRACLPLLGYVAMRGAFPGPSLFPAAALFVYIVALSLSAWEAREDVPESKKRVSRLLLLASAAVAALLPLTQAHLVGWIGLVPFWLWMGLCITRYQSPVAAHVSALLAGIPLVDWVMLFPMALIWVSLEKSVSFDVIFSTAVFLPPAAFILGRALQRLAPAT